MLTDHLKSLKIEDRAEALMLPYYTQEIIPYRSFVVGRRSRFMMGVIPYDAQHSHIRFYVVLRGGDIYSMVAYSYVDQELRDTSYLLTSRFLESVTRPENLKDIWSKYVI